MDHDFDAQREATRSAWNNISAEQDVPKSAVLELQFVPDECPAGWKGFERCLAEAGYQSRRYEDGTTLEASIGPIDLSLEAIWHHEATTTKIAIGCGFRPDGWGFFLN